MPEALNLVGLADFFKCPADARITRQSFASIGEAFTGGNDDGHREVLLAKIIARRACKP